MARIRRYRRRVAGLALLAGLWLAPAVAEDQGANAGTDLYDHPVLAVDPGMHTGTITAQAVDHDPQQVGNDDGPVEQAHVRRSGREHAPEQPERGDDEGVAQDHQRVRAPHGLLGPVDGSHSPQYSNGKELDAGGRGAVAGYAIGEPRPLSR